MPLIARNIVFVHGLFGWGPPDHLSDIFPYWGEALNEFQGGPFKIHEAKVGPVSSFHDRACELYAQIRGRRVDYGDAHSREAGHDRFSPTLNFEGRGFVEDWSAKNPVILVGHSAGAQTCLTLQRLLREGLWNAPGDETNADWVEAIVCVAGVLNGSTLPYMFGCGKASGKLSHGLPANAITSVITLVNAAGQPLNFTPNPISLWLDHWAGGATAGSSANWFQTSAFVQGFDNLAFDLTLQGCQAANDRFEPNDKTYYLSLVTGATRSPRLLETVKSVFGRLLGRAQPRAIPEASMIALLAPSAIYQACVTFDVSPIRDWGAGDLTLGAWTENDGAVSTISQRYPFTGIKPSPHEDAGFMHGQPVQRGKWFFERVENVIGLRFDHFDVVCGAATKLRLPEYVAAHEMLWRKVRERLTTLCNEPGSGFRDAPHPVPQESDPSEAIGPASFPS